MPFNPGNVRKVNALGGKRPQATGIVLIPKNAGNTLATSNGSTANYGGNTKFGLYPSVGMSYLFENKYLSGSMFNAQVEPGKTVALSSTAIPEGATVFQRNPEWAASAIYGSAPVFEIPQFTGRRREIGATGTSVPGYAAEHFVKVTIEYRRAYSTKLNCADADNTDCFDEDTVQEVQLTKDKDIDVIYNCSRAYIDAQLDFFEKEFEKAYPGQDIILNVYYEGEFLDTVLPVRIYKTTYNYASKYNSNDDGTPKIAPWHAEHPDNTGAAPGDYASGEGPFSFTWMTLSYATTSGKEATYYKLQDKGYRTGFNARPALIAASIAQDNPSLHPDSNDPAEQLTMFPWYGDTTMLLTGVGTDDDPTGKSLSVTTKYDDSANDLGLFHVRTNFPAAEYQYLVRGGTLADLDAGTTTIDERYNINGYGQKRFALGFDPRDAPDGATMAGGSARNLVFTGSPDPTDYMYINDGNEWPVMKIYTYFNSS